MENYSNNSMTSQAQQKRKALENPYYKSRSEIMNTIMYGNSEGIAQQKPATSTQTVSKAMPKAMPKSSKSTGAKMSTGNRVVMQSTPMRAPVTSPTPVSKAGDKERINSACTTTTFAADSAPTKSIVAAGEEKTVTTKNVATISMSTNIVTPVSELTDKEFLAAFDVPISGMKSKTTNKRKASSKQAALTFDIGVFIILLISNYLMIGSMSVGVVPAIVLSLSCSVLISVITFFGMRKGESKLLYISLFLVYACVTGGIAAILRASFLTHMTYLRVYLWTFGGSITLLVGIAEIINGVGALFTSSNVRQLQKITKN